MNLIKKFDHYIYKHNLVHGQNKILLAVSGGVDSVVLLDLFLQIQSRLKLILSVVHVNHGLRGERANFDEIFVRDWIGKMGFPFYSLKIDVKCYSKREKLSIEEGGRNIRFDFFEALRKRLYYDKVALAHHAHDQAETIIMNLTRGSGIKGMCGIQPMRESIIHPLLFATKEEIVTYAHDRRLRYVEDVTNRDRTFLRNRIRWDILKQMKDCMGPHIIPLICRTGMAMRETHAFIEFESRKALKQVIAHRSQNEIILDIVKFLSYFRIIQKTVLIQILNEVYKPNPYVRSLEIEGIMQLIEKSRNGSVYQLKNDIKVVKHDNRISFIKTFPIIKQVRIHIDQYHDFPDMGMQFHAECLKGETKKNNFTCDRWTEYIDYDTLSFPLIIRSWIQGDWFRPLGMRGKKKLHDFFIDAKVPRYKRFSVPLLTGGNNIVWVLGYRVDDRFKVTDQTKNIS